MDLTELSLGVEKRKLKRRVGRGVGSGHGKTAGRGHKGQYASAGARLPAGYFEGGQTPLFRRSPKRGFSNNAFRKTYHVVNVGDLDSHFKDGDVVDAKALRKARLANGQADGIRILGTGSLSKKLTVKASFVSKSAGDKIQGAGGAVELVAPPKPPVRNKMKPRPPKPTTTR